MSRMNGNKASSDRNSPSIGTTELEAQVKTYQSDTALNKLDTVAHLYERITQQQTKISELVAKNGTLTSQLSQKQSFEKIKTILDGVNASRVKSESNEIESLKTGLKRVRSQLAELKASKNSPQTEIPSFTHHQLVADLTEQTKLKAQNQNLKRRISLLEGQNKRLSSISATNTRYTEFKLQVENDIRQMKSHIENDLSSLAEKDSQNRRLQGEHLQLKIKSDQYSKDFEVKSQKIKRLATVIRQTFSTISSIELKDVKLSAISNKLATAAKTIINSQDNVDQARQRETFALIKQLFSETNQRIIQLNSKNESNATTIKTLGDQKNQIERNLSAEIVKNRELTRQKEELSKTIKQQTQAKELLTNAKVKLEEKVNQLNIKIAEHIKSIQNLNDEISSQKAIILMLDNAKQQNQLQIEGLNNQNNRLRDRVADLQKEIAKKTAAFQKIKSDLENQRNRLLQSKKRLEETQAKQTEAIKTLEIKLNLANKNINEKDAKIRGLQQESSQLNDEIRRADNEIDILKTKNGNLQARGRSLQSDISSLNSQIRTLKDESSYSQALIKKINTELIKETSQQFIGEPLNLKALSPDKNKQLQKQILNIKQSWKSHYNAAKFFNGSEIVPKESIEWVLQKLVEHEREIPFESKLIYKYDPLNTVNFHKYFDLVPNLIVFIKISNGTIIGGYTAYPVDADKPQKPGRGFIFSLTNERVYNMRSEPRLPVTAYDSYYFILGNAQIRIKSQQKKVFSNFGIANSTFDNGNDLRTRFLNVNDMANNQLQIEGYQFYQLNFKY